MATERARREIGGRRNDRPNDNAALGKADIDAVLVDRADIVLASGRIDAVQVARRAEDEAEAAADIAGQDAGGDAALGMGFRSDRSAAQGQGTGRQQGQTVFLQHSRSSVSD